MLESAFSNTDTVMNKFKRNSDSDTVKYSNKKESARAKAKKVDFIADQLVAKFDNPTRRAYYCKVGWKLPEATIWQNVEKSFAKGVNNPQKMFTFLCEMFM